MHRADAIGLDIALQRLGAQVGLVATIAEHEAGALPNEDFSGFTMDLQAEVKPEDLLEEQFEELLEK